MSLLFSVRWWLFFSTLLPYPDQAPKPAGGWVYTRSVSASGQVIYKASIDSPTQLDMGYPFGKGAVTTLTIKNQDKKTSLYLEVSKGYLTRSYLNGTARIRFDRQPARQFPLLAAANGRANIVFLDADRAFVQSIRQATQLDVDLQFTGQPNRHVTFPVAGLSWSH